MNKLFKFTAHFCVLGVLLSCGEKKVDDLKYDELERKLNQQQKDIDQQKNELLKQQLDAKEQEIEALKERNNNSTVQNHVSQNKNLTQSNYSGFGLYPEASERYLSEDEVASKSARELKIMRNEIFARHGYVFKTKDMIDYFSNQSWYEPAYENVNSMISKIEKANIELIKSYE